MRDPDFANGKITVRHNFTRRKGRFAITETKTKQFPRAVPMLPAVVAALRNRLEWQQLAWMMLGEAWQGMAWGDLVFTNKKGGLLSGEYTYQHFAGLLDRVGLPHVRLHDLRHAASSSSSMLAALGFPPREVMRLLSHSNISTTLGIYTHSTEGVRREAMEGLGRVLCGEGAA